MFQIKYNTIEYNTNEAGARQTHHRTLALALEEGHCGLACKLCFVQSSDDGASQPK